MKTIVLIFKKYMKNNQLKFFLAMLLFVSVSLLAMLPAKITQLIIDNGFEKKNFNIILVMTVALITIYILNVIFDYVSNNIFINISTDVLKKFKDEIYNKVLNMDLSFFSNNEVGYINSRMNEINSIDAIFSSQTLKILMGIFQLIFAVIILFQLNYKMLLLMLIPLPLFYIISRKTTKSLKERINQTLESGARYSGKINESLKGIERIKESSLEQKEQKKINDLNSKLMANSKRQSITANFYTEALTMLNYILLSIIYILGGWFFIKGEITIGIFFAFSSYVGKIYSPIFTFTSMSIVLQPAFISFKRVNDFFFKELDNDIDNGTNNIKTISKIEFKNVYFGYKNNEKLVIENANILIKENDHILIKGVNGSGKSTLIKLMLKLYHPNSGYILINDNNIDNIKRDAIINDISYVAQKSFLFNDTIKNNIIYGVDNYSEEKYDHIIQSLGIDKLIEKMKTNGNDLVGENGFKLSGGEIQKISIARAILKNNNIFIFDEATSNLDQESRFFIKNFIENSKEKTFIIVDHTDLFKDICNKIYEVKNGEVFQVKSR